MLLRTAIKLHTLSLVLLKEKWRGQGKRDAFCGLYYNHITPVPCHHTPSPHREVMWGFLQHCQFFMRLYQFFTVRIHISYLVLCPASLPSTTQIAQSFLEQENTTEMSQAKSLPWDISEPSFCVRPHKLAPQSIHVTEMLKLSKRTDSWKKHRAGISEVF